MFFSYGFFSEETIVFSIPFSINIENLGINIYCKGNGLIDDSMKVERFGNKIILEGFPIANFHHPKLPYDYYNEIFRNIMDINMSQDLLFKILQLNISIRKKILYESQLIDNNVSKNLTKLMSYEISLISSHN